MRDLAGDARYWADAMFVIDYGTNLRAIREAAGRTQGDVAAEAGAPKSSVSRVESGDPRRVGKSAIRRILSVYAVMIQEKRDTAIDGGEDS